MDSKEQILELKGQVKALEEFKHNLEKKIYAAVVVAGLLGGLGIFGAKWINDLEAKLDKLTNRTAEVEENLSNWDDQVTKALAQLSLRKEEIFKDIDSKSEPLIEKFMLQTNKKIAAAEGDFSTKLKQQESVLEALSNKVELTGNAKLKEIKSVKIADLLAELKNGSHSLVLSGLSINNKSGSTVVGVYPDESNDGDGFIRINSESGERRILLYSANDRPQLLLYNTKEKIVSRLGVYTDGDIGYIRQYSEDGETVLIEIDSNSKGGTINQYHKNGRSIIYIGPENNSGNGLFNATEKDGGKTVSHTP